MFVQTPGSSIDRIGLHKEWEAMRDEFHRLVKSIPANSFKRPTLDTRWSVAEILTHMMMSVELVPQEIESVRKGKDFLNFPAAIVGVINLVLIKIRARNATPLGLLEQYDRAFGSAMLAWEGVADDEWEKGANFFGEGYRTLSENYALGIAHFNEHADQIRKSLG